MFNKSQITPLKNQIKQLQKENALLRACLRNIMDTAYRAVNHGSETPSNELNPKEIAEWRQKMRKEEANHA